MRKYYVSIILMALIGEVLLAQLPETDLGSRAEGRNRAEQGKLEIPVNQVELCSLRLIDAAGKLNDTSADVVNIYLNATKETDVEFLEYMMSIIYVESQFNRNAISPMQARGLMQMTLPAVQEAAQFCNIKQLPDLTKLHDSHTNIKYGTCFLRKLYDELDGDWTRVLITYNGGYRQLIKYDKGETIATETANYVLKVERALRTICRKKLTDTNNSEILNNKEISNEIN